MKETPAFREPISAIINLEVLFNFNMTLSFVLKPLSINEFANTFALALSSSKVRLASFAYTAISSGFLEAIYSNLSFNNGSFMFNVNSSSFLVIPFSSKSVKSEISEAFSFKEFINLFNTTLMLSTNDSINPCEYNWSL